MFFNKDRPFKEKYKMCCLSRIEKAEGRKLISLFSK